MKESSFTPFDYTVLVAILLVSLVIGLFHGFQFKTLWKKIRTRKVASVSLKDKNESIEMNGSTEANTENSQVTEYLTANGSMSAIPIAFSLFASFYSATSLLGMVKQMLFLCSNLRPLKLKHMPT
jgi:hypothetical protein